MASALSAQMASPPGWLNYTEAARLLGVNRHSIAHWINLEMLDVETAQFGRRRYISAASISRHLQPQPATSQPLHSHNVPTDSRLPPLGGVGGGVVAVGLGKGGEFSEVTRTSENGKEKRKVSRGEKREKKVKKKAAKPLTDGTMFEAARFAKVFEAVTGGRIGIPESSEHWRWVADKYGQEKAVGMWEAFVKTKHGRIETTYISARAFAKVAGEFDPDRVVADPLSLL